MAKRRSKKSSGKIKANTSPIQFKPMGNSSKDMCGCCGCGSRGLAWLFLVIGVLFLLQDLGWIRWWTLSWFTLLFLVFGIWHLKK